MENIVSKWVTITRGIKLTKKSSQCTSNHMATTTKWNIAVSVMLVCFWLLQMHRLTRTEDTVRADFNKAISSTKTKEDKTKIMIQSISRNTILNSLLCKLSLFKYCDIKKWAKWSCPWEYHHPAALEWLIKNHAHIWYKLRQEDA